MNTDGVRSDNRKRIESERLEPPFDRHPQCIFCQRRGRHIHEMPFLAVSTERIYHPIRMAEYPSSDPT